MFGIDHLTLPDLAGLILTGEAKSRQWGSMASKMAEQLGTVAAGEGEPHEIPRELLRDARSFLDSAMVILEGRLFGRTIEAAPHQSNYVLACKAFETAAVPVIDPILRDPDAALFVLSGFIRCIDGPNVFGVAQHKVAAKWASRFFAALAKLSPAEKEGTA